MKSIFSYLSGICLITIFTLFVTSCSQKQESKTVNSNLGQIVFENSGSKEAQEPFYRGVLALHNFWYPVALSSFKEARKIDPDFALAYWGEAMSYNRSLWQVQDKEKALEVLKLLGESSDQRLEKAKTEMEKDLIKSLDYLYSDKEDKLERDLSYMTFMESLYQKYPNNDEVAAIYALSLLGVLRDNQGNENTRMKCASVAQEILDRNQNHPGALHYKIHALDDPLHAILALKAANRYSEVAPESNHALHMPSHIYVQLGMWDKVRKSNISARKASERWVANEDLDILNLDNHSLAWLSYSYTQMGLFDSAMIQLNRIGSNNADTADKRSRHYEIDILCRNWIERTEDLEDYSIDYAQLEEQGSIDHCKYYFTKGWYELENGHADSSYEYIVKMESNIAAIDSNDMFDKSICSIYLNELKGLYYYQTKGFLMAEEYLKKAVDLEESLNAPTGPPDVIKPIHELYGELSLKEEEIDKAIDLFNQSLARTPNRSMSRIGLARAYRLKGDLGSAKYQYQKFAENYARRNEDVTQTEALSFLKNNYDVTSVAQNESKKENLSYDSKLKISQCLPLN